MVWSLSRIPYNDSRGRGGGGGGAARYLIGPLLSSKVYINGPIFLDSYVKGPIFLTSWYMHIFFAGCLFSWYYMNWLWYLCNNQQKMGTKIKGQYMNRSTFWMIKYMIGSVFSKARYMNGVGFEILARTPVPKLPLSYPPKPWLERATCLRARPTMGACGHTMEKSVLNKWLKYTISFTVRCRFWGCRLSQDILKLGCMLKLVFSLLLNP